MSGYIAQPYDASDPVIKTSDMQAAISSQTNPTLVGYTLTGPSVVAGTAMAALAIDMTKPLNTKSISANSTFTFSAATPSPGTMTVLKITTDATDRVATIPSCWSYARNANITSFTVTASTTMAVTFEYTGARWEIYGDPVETSGTGSYLLSNGTAPSLTSGQTTAALGIKTATTTVSVSGATAPTSGQVLRATSTTTATWQTLSATTFGVGSSDRPTFAGAIMTGLLSLQAGATFSGVGGIAIDFSGLTGGLAGKLANNQFLNWLDTGGVLRTSIGRSVDDCMYVSAGSVKLCVSDSTATHKVHANSTGVAFNGSTPVAKQTLGSAASDAGTTQTLANNLRTALINLGLGQT